MEKNKFTVKRDLEISFVVKIHNYVAGLLGRKDLLRGFCAKSGIDYKPKVGHKYVLPDSFLIEHDELKYLGNIRDKDILGFYVEYKNCQFEIGKQIGETRGDIAIQDERIEMTRNKLKKLQGSVTGARDPQLKIKLQNDVGLAKTALNNEKAEGERLTARLDGLEAELVNNQKNWRKQVEMIDSLFEQQKGRFVRSISKKVRVLLNFTDFKSELPAYSDSVKQIIEGEY